MNAGNTESQSPVLQARLNITGGNDPCILCGRWRERTIGKTETYLAETSDWVCADCAFVSDPDLARFAYDRDGVSSKGRRQLKHDHYFGACPECGSEPFWRNIYKNHWLSCERHGLKWWIGSNLFSSWQSETDADWKLNAERLKGYRKVEPHHNEPTFRERLIYGLSEMRRKFCGVPF